MNKLNNSINGGFPLTNDDLTFIEDNAMEYSIDMIKGLSGGLDAVILNGGEISVTNSGGLAPILNITDGSLFYLDEIYKIDASSTALAPYTTYADVLTTYEWDLVVTSDTPVTFKNATVNDAYQYRKATLVSIPTTWSGLSANIPTLSSVITPVQATESISGVSRLATYTELKDGTNPNVIPSVANLGGYETFTISAGVTNSSFTFLYARYKKYGKLMFISCAFSVQANATLAYMDVTVPSGIFPYSATPSFIPTIPAEVTVTTSNPGTKSNANVLIKSNTATQLYIYYTDSGRTYPATWASTDKVTVYCNFSYIME